MSASSSMLLLGIGTSGVRIARGVARAFGDELRVALTDTDASTAADGETFALLGGDRLSGRGTGGNVVTARLAAEDSLSSLDGLFEGVRFAVVVTALGGGTGGGATFEIVKRLSELGIVSAVFATLPFGFEGDERQRNARGVLPMIEDVANAVFPLALDQLVGASDNMDDAMRHATDAVASGVTLFWRLLAKPGYIRLDEARVRQLLQNAGRGRFAAVTVQGPNRAADAVDRLAGSELLAHPRDAARAILCGVLAGDDLRLSELGVLAEGVRRSFGEQATFDLGTVNDAAAFSGRLAVVLMLFETNRRTERVGRTTDRARGQTTLGVGPSGRGRFNNVERTEWHGEDLDVPTFVRHHITLDF